MKAPDADELSRTLSGLRHHYEPEQLEHLSPHRGTALPQTKETVRVVASAGSTLVADKGTVIMKEGHDVGFLVISNVVAYWPVTFSSGTRTEYPVHVHATLDVRGVMVMQNSYNGVCVETDTSVVDVVELHRLPGPDFSDACISALMGGVGHPIREEADKRYTVIFEDHPDAVVMVQGRHEELAIDRIVPIDRSQASHASRT